MEINTNEIYHSDHLGSSSYITDNFGRPSHYYEYLPFGELMTEHNQSKYYIDPYPTQNMDSYNNPYKFNDFGGKSERALPERTARSAEMDKETGMYYYGARYYDPRISIFVSVDPLAEEFPNYGGYVYTMNNPINLVDPTGMAPEDWIFHFVGGQLMRMEDTGKGSGIYIVNDGVSVIGRKPYNQRISEMNQITKFIGERVNKDLNYSYAEVYDSKGGWYLNNNVTITNNSYQFGNYNDVISSIEHEILHHKFGATKTFKDHVNVYLEQAKSDTFKKTSSEYKNTNAQSFAKRALSAYISGDYNQEMFKDVVKEYQKYNPKNRINIKWSPTIEAISIEVNNYEIKYDEKMKPNE